MPNTVILVVEDEPILRMAALDMLEDAGFDAVGAHDAATAISTLDGCPGIDVLFTDVDLGAGQDGLWLAAEVSRTRPRIRIIVTSGHRYVTQDLVPEGAVFVGKPYPEDLIISEVRRLVG